MDDSLNGYLNPSHQHTRLSTFIPQYFEYLMPRITSKWSMYKVRLAFGHVAMVTQTDVS